MADAERELTREDFRYFVDIQTRWMDNDIYGHVNNVEYYSYIDTMVSHFLFDNVARDYTTREEIGLVVETKCAYRRQISFPDMVEGALRVAKIGRSSVTYEVGLFKKGQDEICAHGHFVHVYVNRSTNRPIPIPEDARAAMEKFKVG